MIGNVPSPGFPGGSHALLTDDRLFTDRAAIVKAGEFAKAMCVNGVTTREVLGRLAGREHVLAADRTVVLVLVFEALVGFKDTDGDTHAAFLAVSK